MVGQEFRYVREGVRPEFAPRSLFAQLEFDSYAAYSLTASSGEQLGLIVVMDRRPLADRALTEAMLKIFAVRAGAELERARADEALRVSEASYRAIFEANEDAIFIHDWDTGRILDVSPKAAALYGHAREAWRELRVADVSSNVAPYTEDDAMRLIQQAKVRGAPLRFEWRARHKDGHLMWHEVTLKRATIAGEPRILAFVRDVTERKQAEEAVRASEEQYRAVFNASADGLTLRDADFRVVDVNPALLAMTGLTREEAIGSTRMLFTPPEDHEATRRLFEEELRGEASQYVSEAVRKDGTRFWVEVQGVPLHYRGKPHVFVIARDITERKRAEEAVRASEEQYRAVFNASADALVLWNSELKRVDVNPAFERLYGYTREEVLNTAYPEHLPLEYVERRRDLVRRTLAGERCQVELEAVRKDGERLQVEVRTIPVGYRGEPHVLAIARDITARKQAEEAVRASEEQYRAIFNASADALVLWNSALKRVDVNPAYERLFGVSREEVVGTGHANTLPADYVARRHEVLRRTLAGEPCELEIEAMRRSGERFQSEVRTIPVRHRGEPHALAIVRDVTERKRAETALRASEEQYRAIFDSSADTLVLWDADFRIVDVNAAYEAMTGYRREELIGVDRVVAIPSRVNDTVKALHARALAGEPVQFETEMVAKDGRRGEVELRGVRILHQGKPHVLYIGRDITERKRAEGARLALEAQLRQAQKMEAIGQLTGGIAHDFNNILTSIVGYVTLAAERENAAGDAKLASYLEQATRSCRRARDLIQQMLTFSRGQRGERRPIDLRKLVAESARLLHSSMPATLALETSNREPVPLVSLDPVQAEQVLLNLCINARDALQGEGRVQVAVRRASHAAVCASCRAAIDGEFVELAVSDDGPGIAPEVMERIFEPFFSTKEVGKGSGMGLAMVHGIAHDHGGHVLVETRPGRGTTFRVLFPALRTEDDQTEHETLTGFAPVARKRSLRGRVLLVDDEEMVRGFMRELLEGWGLQVTVARDGAEARDAVARAPQDYDLVITDQTMPRLTGVELARQLAVLRPALPVVLYSGYADAITDAQVQAVGIRALVRKPVEPAALRAVLEPLLSAGARVA
jgi:PAS domain S-box-containing protein